MFRTSAADDWIVLLEALEQPHRAARLRRLAVSPFVGWDAGRPRATTTSTARAAAAALAAGVTSAGSRRCSRRSAATSGCRRGCSVRSTANGGSPICGTSARRCTPPPSAGRPGRRRARMAAAPGGRVRRDAAIERSRRLESDAAAVQVVTCTRSKGLEFPIVYVPFGWDRYDLDADIPLFHDDAGPAVAQRRRQARVPDSRSRPAPTQQRGIRRGPAAALRRADPGAVPGDRVVGAERTEHRVRAAAPAAVHRDPAEAVPETGSRARRRRGGGRASALAARRVPVGRPCRRTRCRPPWQPAGAGPRSACRRRAAPSARHGVAAQLVHRADCRRARGVTRGSAANPRWGRRTTNRRPAAPAADGGAGADIRRPWPSCPAAPHSGRSSTPCWNASIRPPRDLTGRAAHACAARSWRGSGRPGSTPTLAGRAAAGAATSLGPLADGRASSTSRRPIGWPSSSSSCRCAAATGQRARRPAWANSRPCCAQHLPRRRSPARLRRAARRSGARRAALSGYLTGSIDAVLRTRRASTSSSTTRPTGSARRTLRSPACGLRRRPRRASAMIAAHYPLQALLYQVALHRYLRWRLTGYDAGPAISAARCTCSCAACAGRTSCSTTAGPRRLRLAPACSDWWSAGCRTVLAGRVATTDRDLRVATRLLAEFNDAGVLAAGRRARRDPARPTWRRVRRAGAARRWRWPCAARGTARWCSTSPTPRRPSPSTRTTRPRPLDLPPAELPWPDADELAGGVHAAARWSAAPARAGAAVAMVRLRLWLDRYWRQEAQVAAGPAAPRPPTRPARPRPADRCVPIWTTLFPAAMPISGSRPSDAVLSRRERDRRVGRAPARRPPSPG